MNFYNGSHMIWLFTFLVAAISVTLRCAQWRDTFPEPGKIIFSFSDTYYHLRRVELALADFPHLVSRDWFSNFPIGSEEVWPPFFDHLILGFGWILGWGKATLFSTQLAAAWISPLVAAITLVFVFLIGKHVLNARVGLLACLFVAMCPAHINYSLLGRPDHHVAEFLFFTLFIYFFLKAISQNSKLLPWSLASGLSYAAAVLSSVITIGLIPVGLLILIWSRFSKKLGRHTQKRLNKAFFFSMLGTLSWVLPVALSSSRGQIGQVSFEQLSLFQPAILLFCLLLSGAFFMLDRRTQKISRKGSLGAIVLTCSAAILTLFLHSDLRNALTQCLGFLFQPNLILSTVREARSLFFTDEKWSMLYAWSNLGLLLPLFPIAIIMVLRRLRLKNEGASPSRTLIFYWGAVTFFYALFQLRFTAWLCIPLSLIISLWLESTFFKSSRRTFRQIGILVALFIIIANLSILKETLRLSYVPLNDHLKSFAWIDENTPPSGDFTKPEEKPPWGILAPWDMGHLLLYKSRRPVIANNFLWQAHKPVNFFLAPDEEEAYQLLEENQARYIVSTRMLPSGRRFSSYIKIHGDRPDDYFAPQILPSGKRTLFFKDRFYRTMYTRLHLFNGSGLQLKTQRLRPLHKIRLVHESSLAVIGIEKIATYGTKIFEFVPGAQLKGEAPPGTLVQITCPIRTNHLSEFIWYDRVLADAEGHFEVTLPYATHGTPYRTRPSGPYEIETVNGVTTLETTEEEVTSSYTPVLGQKPSSQPSKPSHS